MHCKWVIGLFDRSRKGFHFFTYILLKFRFEVVHNGHANDLFQSQEAEENDK